MLEVDIDVGCLVAEVGLPTGCDVCADTAPLQNDPKLGYPDAGFIVRR